MSLLLRFPAAALFIVLCANFIIRVENKSYFGIGSRTIGDQLLLKDVLQTPPISLTEGSVIKFKYAIEEPITYLEIESEKNVHAKVEFSYEFNLVEGTISSVNEQEDREIKKPQPFEVLIQIYGFNESTTVNVNSANILNKDQQFNGLLKPIYHKKINQSLSVTQHDLKAINDLDVYYEGDAVEDDDDEDNDTEDEEDIDYEEDDFNNIYDKIIEQGQRQQGDFLVYEINQTSATTTELPTNHSVTFYYVDIYYITYVQFTIYEHYLYHPLNSDANTYIVEYAHISPTTLKAIVTDHRTTSLFVQMQMYGFHPTLLPVDYKPFLSNSQTSATTKPISSLTQLKILMNAQQTGNTIQQSQQQQQQQLSTNGGLLEQATEMGHDISSAVDENKVNCVQQVLSSSSSLPNDSLKIFTHSSIFNLIVTIFVTKLIFM